MSDITTTEGRGAIRERAVLAQEAGDHINDVTFDGRSPSTVAWQTIAASQEDVPALLDALDRVRALSEEGKGWGGSDAIEEFILRLDEILDGAQ